MRVRTLELRLIAAALFASWTLAAALVLLGYRPGGPVDLLVGASAALPALVALAALVWPPVGRGDRVFAALVCLGAASLLVLVPAIGILLGRLVAGGPQTLVPSLEAAYPWLLALVGTSLLAGMGIARRMLGPAAVRGRRLRRGLVVATGLTLVAGGAFASVAVANEIALRDIPATGSRFGPTDPIVEPPPCDEPVAAGSSARIDLHLEGDVDGRPLGSISATGSRSGTDFRWVASVATRRRLGVFGGARIGDVAWTLSPGAGWRRVEIVDGAGGLDARVVRLALAPATLPATEVLGLASFDGARARQCRIAIDGETFRRVFPQVELLIGDADVTRWRGELDYWVFADGELGRVAGSVNGIATGIDALAIQATVTATLTATDRGRVILIPSPPR
ncbi:MAG TPA: hypothetical protein VH720_02895 [Candidatus Limnocylindrales bacterium]